MDMATGAPNPGASQRRRKSCPNTSSQDLIDGAPLARTFDSAESRSHNHRIRWQPNTDVCTICQRRFSVTLRRHHCRVCGRCACARCGRDSEHRKWLRKLKSKANRTWTCVDCEKREEILNRRLQPAPEQQFSDSDILATSRITEPVSDCAAKTATRTGDFRQIPPAALSALYTQFSPATTATPATEVHGEQEFDKTTSATSYSVGPHRENWINSQAGNRLEELDQEVSAMGEVDGSASAQSAFHIQVDNSEGQRLGVQLDASDGSTLLISHILGGLIQEWNSEHLTPIVSTGDRIIEVNDAKGNSAEMLAELRRPQELKLWIEQGS